MEKSIADVMTSKQIQKSNPINQSLIVYHRQSIRNETNIESMCNPIARMKMSTVWRESLGEDLTNIYLGKKLSKL